MLLTSHVCNQQAGRACGVPLPQESFLRVPASDVADRGEREQSGLVLSPCMTRCFCFLVQERTVR